MKQILNEEMTQSLFETIETGRKDPAILRTIKGIVADFNPNRNGRVYPRELWEKVINSEYVKEMIASKMLLGEADHPAERVEIEIKTVSHAINKLWIEGDAVLAEMDILNTPEGQKVNTLLEYGSKIGVSSRGAGEVGSDGRVDPDSYQFFTFDIVVRPSVGAARIAEEEVRDVSNLKVVNEGEIASILSSYKNLDKKLEEAQVSKGFNYLKENEIKTYSSNIIDELLKENEELNK